MFWRTLVLAVLWLEVQTQYTVNIGEKDHVYNTTLNDSRSSIELHVDKTALQSARHGYLIIYPTAEYSYEVRSGAEGEEKLRCIGSRSTACVLNLDEEEHHLKSIKGYNIEIAMNCYGDCQGTLGVSVSKYLTSTHIGFTNIMLDDISELKVELNPTISNEASKLRLHAGGYSKKHDLHSLTLSCYGNAMKDEWPTAQAHDFELKHIHGNELSHVIYSRDRFFCRNKSNCKYRLKCDTFAIYRIVLYAIDAANIEPVTEFESYAFSPTTGLYKLELDQSMLKQGAKVYITLDNVEGNSKLYVNPAFLPEFSPSSLYKAEGLGPKQITISPDELRRALRNDATIKELYIMVMAEGSSSYFLKVSYQRKDDAFNMELNRPQSGLIASAEMKDFVLEFETINEEHERKFVIELESNSMQLFMYARRCNGELSCGFFDDRVVKQKSLPDDSDIKMNESPFKTKTLEVAYSCGRKNSYKSVKVSHNLTIYRCVLNVGVYSNEKNSTFSNHTTFTLKIQDKSMLHLMPTNRWTHFTVFPENPLALQVNIHRRQYNIYSVVNFMFDVHYGTASVFVSKTNKNPCNETDIVSKAELKEFLSSIVTIERSQIKDNRLSGAYYVCIKAHAPTSVTVISEPIIKKYKLGDDDPMLSNVPMLTPNHQVLGELPSNSDKTLFFAISTIFDINEPQSVKIHVTPIRGKFRTFVSTNGKRPSPTQTLWNTVGETIEILPRDKQIEREGYYIIGVQLANPQSGTPNGLPNKFMITFSFGEKHVILRKGIPFMGESTFISPNQYLHIKFPMNTTENITIFRTSLQRYTSVIFSFNQSNPFPSLANKDAVMPPFFSAFVLNKEIWSKYCNQTSGEQECTLYTNVQSAGPARFSIQYTLNGGPITIPHGYPFSIPTINDPKTPLYLIYHVNKEQNAEIEIRPLFQQIRYFIKWAKEEQRMSDYKFPEEETPSVIAADSMSQPTFTTHHNTTNENENDVLLFTLYQEVPSGMLDLLRYPNHVQYTYNGLLEISTDSKFLVAGRPVTVSSHSGEWKFFKLRHSSFGTDSLMVHVEMITGVTEIYISKGLHKYPSEKYFLKKRQAFYEASLSVSREELPYDMSYGGDYMVGIRCRTPVATYQVIYEQSNARYLTLELGMPVKYKVSSFESTFLEVPSDGINQDIVITFHSRYAHIKLHAIARKIDNLTDNETFDSVLPTDENYEWSAEQSDNLAGFGRMVISTRDPHYCIMCTYIIRVQASEDDKVDFTAIKKSQYSLIRIVEGKNYIGDLKKGENDTYALEVPGNETFLNLNCKILKGNITFVYSLDYTFANSAHQYIVPQRTKDEFFNINFNHISSYIRDITKARIMRFIRIESLEEDSQYSFSVVSDGMITELTTVDSQQAILGMGAQHIYYFPSTQNETVNVYFHLRSVVNMKDVDFQFIVDRLHSMVTVYQVKTLQEVESRSYDYEIKARYNLYGHELQVNFKADKGYVVAVVRSNANMAINYDIELSRFGVYKLRTGHEKADFIEANVTKQYLVNSKEDNYDAKVHFETCMNSVHASYVYTDRALSNVRTDHVRSEEHPVTLTSERFERDNIPIRADKTIKVTVTKGDFEGDVGINKALKYFPAIYRIHHEITPRTGGRDQSLGEFLVGDLKNYGEVEVFSDSDQNVKFEGLQFHEDFLKKHADSSILINYTLYISKDKRMLTFMKHCGYYMIDQAVEAFKTTDFYSFSIQEYHSLELDQKRKEVPILSLKPHSMSFGGTFHGVIVAEVRLWPNSVQEVMTFPKAKTLRVYYNEFEFEPTDNSIALVFLFTFLGLTTVVFLFYVLSKNKIFNKLRRIKFIDNIMSEFSEEDVGNNLVLEVIDYKKHKKARAEKKTQSSLDQSLTNQSDSGVELRDSSDDSKAA